MVKRRTQIESFPSVEKIYDMPPVDRDDHDIFRNARVFYFYVLWSQPLPLQKETNVSM